MLQLRPRQLTNLEQYGTLAVIIMFLVCVMALVYVGNRRILLEKEVCERSGGTHVKTFGGFACVRPCVGSR
jgi:hypothetical protein